MFTVYVDGYWLDDKSQFKDYKCIIFENPKEDEYTEDSPEDESVFYYFDSYDDFCGMLKENSAGRKDTEFVITSFRALCPCCQEEKPKSLGITEKCHHCQKGNCEKCK